MWPYQGATKAPTAVKLQSRRPRQSSANMLICKQVCSQLLGVGVGLEHDARLLVVRRVRKVRRMSAGWLVSGQVGLASAVLWQSVCKWRHYSKEDCARFLVGRLLCVSPAWHGAACHPRCIRKQRRHASQESYGTSRRCVLRGSQVWREGLQAPGAQHRCAASCCSPRNSDFLAYTT